MNMSINPTTSNAVPPSPALKKSIFADLDALRLPYGESALGGAKEVLLRIPVRKPQRQEFFRIHPDPAMSLTTAIFEEKDTREFYFVSPDMMGSLTELGDISPVVLMLAKTRQNALLMVPFKLPTETSVASGWFETALEAAARAKSKWVRMAADMSLGGYRVYEAQGQLDEPEWPSQTFNELLEIAFKNKVIEGEDHPVFNKLLGRI